MAEAPESIHALTGTGPSAAPVASVPDHELLQLIGRGSYGEVWLAKNTLGTFRAVKIVFADRFRNRRPFEREFNGVKKFEPISRLHEGLMDVLQVGRNEAAGYFYYVMELADDDASGQSIDPSRYTPRTLASEIARCKRLPPLECRRIGIAIASALDFVHRHALIHRDVKPSNIVFVNGEPKLADIGLVTEMASAESYVGTDGFIPPEGPGTVRADIYSLGKVLYEISTGKDRYDYPELPADLSDAANEGQLLELNKVFLKACRTDPQKRYKDAGAMAADLVGDGRRAWSRRSRWLAAAGAVAACAIAPLFLAWQNATKRKPTMLFPITHGLVAHWSAESNARDRIGGNHGKVLGGTSFVPGMAGSAFSFTGPHAYVEVPDSPALRLSNELTIACWVRRTQADGRFNGEHIVDKGGDWTGKIKNYGMGLSSVFHSNLVQFFFAGGNRAVEGFGDLKWHHCAVVARNGDADPVIYVDGLPRPVVWSEGEARIRLNHSTWPLYIGAQLDPVTGFDYYGKMQVDEVSIYNRALAPSEIQAVLRAGSPKKYPPLLPPGAVGWWRADGNALDSVNTNHGAMPGARIVGYAPGVSGQAFVFDGTSRNRVEIGRSAEFQVQDFTAVAWVKRSSPTTISLDDKEDNGSVCGEGGMVFTYGRHGYGLALCDDGRLNLCTMDVNGVFSTGKVADTNWHQVAATKSGSVVRFYIDAAPASGPLLHKLSFIFDTPVAIGSRADARGGTFFGMIDEVCFFNRALSLPEIAVLHKTVQAERAGVSVANRGR